MLNATDPTSADARVLGALLFVLAVVALPRQQFWAFGIDAAVVIGVALVARVRLRTLSKRLVIEAPFIGFALLLPFVGSAPHTEVMGVSLSQPGLWAGWAIIAKGTLGLATAAILSGTTPPADLVVGLERLGTPRVFTAIAGFMVRYLDVIAGELRRLQIARVSRGDDPRWATQAKATAATAGTLFVRSYERGERVHLAMVSRGFTGTMPTNTATARRSRWLAPLVPAVIATLVCAAAWVLV